MNRKRETRKRAVAGVRSKVASDWLVTEEIRNDWYAIQKALVDLRDNQQITIDPAAFGRNAHSIVKLVRNALQYRTEEFPDMPRASIRILRNGKVAVLTCRTIPVGLKGNFKNAFKP